MVVRVFFVVAAVVRRKVVMGLFLLPGNLSVKCCCCPASGGEGFFRQIMAELRLPRMRFDFSTS